MNTILNVASRLKSVWTAAKTPTEAERARADSIADELPSFRFNVVEPSPDLQQFRLLVGINQDRSFRAPNGFKPDQLPTYSGSTRAAPNMGIYSRVYSAEVKAKRNFKNTSLLINSCLGIQIVVAAALTALGAANHSGSSVTVFGAINTVIAGFLTYLKGSGLPNRIKYYQHQWAKVREYIEQRERDLQCGHSFDIMAEVEKIRGMYEDVKSDIELSQPDRFVGAGSHTALSATTGPFARASALSEKTMSGASSVANNFKGGVESTIREVEDAEKGLSTRLSGHATSFRSGLESKIMDFGRLGHDFVDHGRAVLAEKKNEATGALQSTVRQVGDMEKSVEGQARSAVNQQTEAVRQGFAQQQENVRQTLAQQQENARQGLTQQQENVKRTLSEREAAAHASITEQAEAARAAIREKELAAKAAIINGQAAAGDAVAAHSQAAAAVLAESEAALRSTAKDVVDSAFDAAAGIAPHEVRHDARG